jgi:hypothetical protein
MATSYSTPPADLGRSTQVPWVKYTDGKWWKLTRGEDFRQTTRQARKTFISWAVRNGWATHTHLDTDDPDNVLWVKVEDPIDGE